MRSNGFSPEIESLDAHLEAIRENRPVSRFRLEAMQTVTHGVWPATITVIAALPGIGKSTLLLQLADELAQQGVPVIFLSLEVPAFKLVLKSIARLGKGSFALADVSDMNHREDIASEFRRSADLYRRSIAPMIHIAEGPMTTSELTRLVQDCRDKTGKSPAVFVDYLQLLATDADQPYMDERLAIKATVAGLRDVANTCDVPVFAVSSISRSYYAKNDSLAALAGSGSIEYSFDAVLMLSVEGKTESERATNRDLPERPLIISALKNRYGPLGTAHMMLDTPHATFRDRE